jgi:PTS system mannose-specific IIA component
MRSEEWVQRLSALESLVPFLFRSSLCLMVGGVIVSHGQLGKEMIRTAEMIVGKKIANITSVSIDVTTDVKSSREQIKQAIQSVNSGSGVVIFTDMFGGTPSNISLSFLDETSVEVVTGVNLAMLLQFSTSNVDESFQRIVESLKQRGQENIHIASEFLRQRGKK